MAKAIDKYMYMWSFTSLLEKERRLLHSLFPVPKIFEEKQSSNFDDNKVTNVLLNLSVAPLVFNFVSR